MKIKHLFTAPIFIFLSLLFIPLSSSFAQQKITGKVEIDGLNRKYRLYIPSSYNAQNPMPLVFNLHGITSDGLQQQIYSGMNAVAEENGFIVCYPNGKNRAWNVEFPFPSSNKDDVNFISSLIDSLSAIYTIDLNRVYSCGLSNGGYMSHRLACELSDKIAAIASVSGSMMPEVAEACNPTRPVPMMQIHGTGDPIVFYKGGPLTGMGIEEVVDFWVEKNNCLDDPLVTKVKNKAKLDLSKATRYDYLDCEGKTAVAFYKIKNGGHSWPGSKILVGITNQDFHASTEIWNFFKQFSLDAPPMITGKLELSNSDAVIKDFEIFPNPTTHNLTIQTTFAAPTTLSIGLHNLQGQQITAPLVQSFPSGTISWEYPLATIPAGTYFLKIQTAQTVITKKVMVLK